MFFPSHSLGARILWRMAMRIAVVIVLITLVSYWHVYRSVTAAALDTLGKYVRERGERESQLFLQAEDNLRVLMRAFFVERDRLSPAKAEREFAELFERNADGAVRRRPGFDIVKDPPAYIAARLPVDAKVRRDMVVLVELVRDFGRAWNDRYLTTFLASVSGMAATYWPGVDWYRHLPPDEDFSRYPWVRNVLPENNPERKPRWTGIWHDSVGNRFATTCILPADTAGRFSHYAGTSVSLESILQRIGEVGLDGTRNLIFRADGMLVAHHDDAVMLELRKRKGQFPIPEAGDAHLQAIYSQVAAQGNGVMELAGYNEYLGVARIEGPGWYFVTVMPKSLLGRTAFSTAQVILWLGLASLLLELAIVGWIVRGQVVRPLGLFMERVDAFGRGDWSARTGAVGDDELGRLGAAFDRMAEALEEKQRQLADHAESLEAKVSERTRQLEEKERTKTRFLAAASHDLRQPIQAAGLFLDALARARLGPAEGRIVANLDAAIRSLRELLDALLDVSKLDAGTVEARIVMFDLVPLFERLGGEFAPLAYARDLRFRVRQPARPVYVRSDPDLTGVVMRNLIANAISYTERGGVVVGLRRRGRRAVIQVWDTGIGIAPAHQERIFEEFFQVGNPQRDRSKGLGLGLAIARRVADLMSCRLSCRSVPGRGSVFELELPLGRPPSFPTRSIVPAQTGVTRLAGKHFVVVENDQLVAESLGLWLESRGARVTCYANAEAALAASGIENADAYVTDYRLSPTMNGIDFLNVVRQRAGRRISAVVITGDTSPEFIEATERSGWRILFKPVDPESLLDALNS